MMTPVKYILILSQENIALAQLEAAELLGLKAYEKKGHLIIAHIKKNNHAKIPRLAYTHKVLKLVFECKSVELIKRFESFDWSKIYRDDFCVRIHAEDKKNIAAHNLREQDLAPYVWRKLAEKSITPKVDLNNPATHIEVIIIGASAYVALQFWENNEHFNDRRAHFRPELHPTAMHPKMARGLVNILNPSLQKGFIDPFCGAGGILLEAGLMRVPCTGYDIDAAMLRRCKINLDHYHIDPKQYTLRVEDALAIKSYANVLTDLPYGKSSKKSDDITALYARFIRKINGRAVIVMPDFVDYKKILKKNLSKKLAINALIPHYVHKSLTRMIVLIN